MQKMIFERALTRAQTREKSNKVGRPKIRINAGKRTIYVTDKLWLRLRFIARLKQTSVSDLIEKTMKDYLDSVFK